VRDEADFFLALARGGGFRRLARVDAAGRDRNCLTRTMRPSTVIGMSTTDGAWRTISCSCIVPSGNRKLWTSIEKTRPL